MNTVSEKNKLQGLLRYNFLKNHKILFYAFQNLHFCDQYVLNNFFLNICTYTYMCVLIWLALSVILVLFKNGTLSITMQVRKSFIELKKKFFFFVCGSVVREWPNFQSVEQALLLCTVQVNDCNYCAVTRPLDN